MGDQYLEYRIELWKYIQYLDDPAKTLNELKDKVKAKGLYVNTAEIVNCTYYKDQQYAHVIGTERPYYKEDREEFCNHTKIRKLRYYKKLLDKNVSTNCTCRMCKVGIDTRNFCFE